MKKKSICIIILGCLFALGIVLTTIGLIMGASLKNTSFKITTDSKNKHSVSKKLTNVSLTDTKDIQKIDFDLTGNEVTIRQGEKFSIEGASLKRNEVKNGTWYVESSLDYSTSKINLFGHQIPISFNFDLGFDSLSDAEDIIITLPGHCELEKAVFDITASCLNIAQISCKNISISSFTSSTEIGKINAESVFFDGCMGDTDIEQFHITKKMNLDFSQGNVTLGENSKSSENYCNNLSVDCAMGSVFFTGTLHDKNSFDCALGSLQLTLPGSRKNYDIDSSVAIGDVNYQESALAQSGDNEEYASISIDCAIGDAEICFEN